MELREYFHLALLHALGSRLAGRGWAVKGGTCLRFFHRSPRFSEDMDLDAEPRIRVETLHRGMETVLASRAFTAMLATRGITRLETSAPKQTATVQRWKIALHAGGTRPVTTKVEFSRRRGTLPFTGGIPAAGVLERHALPPFAAQFYPPEEMARQKIAAMAAVSRHAVRDLFDLDHLFTTLRVAPAAVRPGLARTETRAALRKADAFSHRDFREEVLPFLEESLARLYGHADAFERLKDRVRQALTGLAG